MPDTDLPTLQQRVERVLDDAEAKALCFTFTTWEDRHLAMALKSLRADFANDDEAEIARAASVWLRKVNR